MRLNINRIMNMANKAINNKPKRSSNWKYRKNYSPSNTMRFEIDNLQNEVSELRRTISNLMSALKLRRVGEVVMHEKDAGKYDGQY